MKIRLFLSLFIVLNFLISSAFSKDLNIVYITDNNYVTYTLLSLKSMLDNNKSNSKYNFYILENGLTNANMKKIEKFITNNKQNVKFIRCDTTKLDGGENMQKGVLPDDDIYITRIVTAKLLIPDLLPQSVSKALFLDSDTLVKSDIIELYDEDISDYIISMGIDNLSYEPFEEENKEIKPPYYYNSGVLLFNIENWRNKNIRERIFQYTKENPKVRFPDQDILNDVLSKETEIKSFNLKWNNQFRPWTTSLMVPEEENSGIHHYFTKTKPWGFCPHDSILKRNYINFWLKSPFKWEILRHIPKSLKLHYFEFIKEDKKYLL